RMVSARTPNAARKAASPSGAGARPRSTSTKSAGRKRSSPSLNDQVLALADGKTQPEIAAACKGARPNHVGAAIARHKRAGRIEERDGKPPSVTAASSDDAPGRSTGAGYKCSFCGVRIW